MIRLHGIFDSLDPHSNTESIPFLCSLHLSPHRMREEVAAARAAAQNGGDTGDMSRMVNQIESGDINVNSAGGHNEAVNVEWNGKDANTNKIDDKKDKDGDVEMKGDDKRSDKKEEARIEENKPLKRRNYKKKLNILDPAIDLTSTMESFTEVIEDPGNEAKQNVSRSEVQSWFSQVNKHGTMLLYQSLNQRNANKKEGDGGKEQIEIQEAMSNVPKVSYGRNYGAMEVDGVAEAEDVEMKESEEKTPEKPDNVCCLR